MSYSERYTICGEHRKHEAEERALREARDAAVGALVAKITRPPLPDEVK